MIGSKKQSNEIHAGHYIDLNLFEFPQVVGKEWAPNSFSSRFTCLFCAEQFRKDYKLKLHLMMAHKDQPQELMDKAKEELIKAKLDGCVHRWSNFLLIPSPS